MDWTPNPRPNGLKEPSTEAEDENKRVTEAAQAFVRNVCGEFKPNSQNQFLVQALRNLKTVRENDIRLLMENRKALLSEVENINVKINQIIEDQSVLTNALQGYDPAITIPCSS